MAIHDDLEECMGSTAICMSKQAIMSVRDIGTYKRFSRSFIIRLV